METILCRSMKPFFIKEQGMARLPTGTKMDERIGKPTVQQSKPPMETEKHMVLICLFRLANARLKTACG
jgi:hypothetical protein